MSKTRIHVVCQTHWDREHRSNFQETRLLLVEMMDRLMAMFDNDPDFHTFIIDGQTVVLEDYLYTALLLTPGDGGTKVIRLLQTFLPHTCYIDGKSVSLYAT